MPLCLIGLVAVRRRGTRSHRWHRCFVVTAGGDRALPRAASRCGRGRRWRVPCWRSAWGKQIFRDRTVQRDHRNRVIVGSTRPVADRGRAKRDDGRRFGGNACVTSRHPSRGTGVAISIGGPRDAWSGCGRPRRGRSLRVGPCFRVHRWPLRQWRRIDGIRRSVLAASKRRVEEWDCRG